MRMDLKSKWFSSDNLWGYIFILPWVVSFVFFTAYPFILSFKTSFLNVNVLIPEKASFVGFNNFAAAILDGDFCLSLFNVIYNQAVFIPLSMLTALFLAILIAEIKTGAVLYKFVYFLPIIISITISMYIFKYLFEPMGVIQTLLNGLGILKERIYWNLDRWMPMPLLAVFNSWKWFGIMMIIFLAGIAGIDREVLEAARVDGAGWWKQVIRIKIPLLRPQIVFLITVNIINGLQMFNEVFIIFGTDGGPVKAGLTPVLLLYNQGFRSLRMGYSATIGILLAVLIYTVTMVQLRISRCED